MINDKKALLLIFLANSFIWLRSSYGKFSGGKFVDSLGAVLTKFASNNPYPWYKSFLENVATPNFKVFGVLTMWGELLSGLAILIGAAALVLGQKQKLYKIILGLGLLGGSFLNLIFWLASGWTSASTDGLNLVMFAVQFIGFLTFWKIF